MVKRLGVFLVLAIFTVSLAGCATAGKQKDLEIQGLRNQVSVLESQLQSKDEEINSLKESKAPEVKETPATSMVSKKRIIQKRVVAEIKSRPNVRQIQLALKNAGYEPGRIDGHMGRQTRNAIRAFQKANNLPADGRIGKKTWSLLKEYLYKQVK